ncbi:MAG: endopeptidase La, partial [Lachnospiraceae bacterium]|nr:endopeptidase La [Lachnospiraceae bacterium]
TGQLGDVMKESAMAGLSYVRSVAPGYGVQASYFQEHDIHIHIPEGAVPKDGPSAGITMATAVLSAITGRKVRRDLAMTGEISLRGKVMPVGGLKEKILAAKMLGIKTVLVPFENKRDVEEIDREITDGLEILYMKDMDEVVAQAFYERKKRK